MDALGRAAAVRSQWVELVNGIEVRPLGRVATRRCAGGVGAAQRARPAASARCRAAPLPPQWTLMTTVLRRWANGSRWRNCTRRQSSLSNGFGAATASRQRSLQLRVSLP